jgi:hypothetical protein
MANIIRGKNQDTKTETGIADLGKTDFGSKTAIAAFQKTDVKQEQAKADNKVQTAVRKSSPEERASRKAARRGNQTVEEREKASLRLQAAGRSITGAVARSNRQLTQNRNQTSADVQDAWEDPTEVSNKDDVETALQKRLQRAQEEDSKIESQIDGGEPEVSLDQVDSLNGASQPIRDYGNYAALNSNPELLIVMGGLSETFDMLLQKNGIDMQNPAGMTDAQLQDIFTMLNVKKKKTLSEDEEEAELILAGAVGILAIPKIQEKLEELGLNPDEAKSFQGVLKTLLDKVQQDDSPYNHLYKMIKEETEYSIVPDESDTVTG